MARHPICILGIDPGLRRTGWGLIESDGNRLIHIGCGSFETDDRADLVRAVTEHIGAFTLIFQRLAYGPQPRRPRLLWAECAATDDVTLLHAALLQGFSQYDDRPFRPHVTLARIRGNGSAIARRQPIDQELSFTQQVGSIELFQSPPPGGSGYKILASLRLGDEADAASGT